jgi:Flp pilus assembly pilin Flp
MLGYCEGAGFATAKLNGGDAMKGLVTEARELAREEDGQDIVEYALLAAFIAIVAAAILIQMAPLIQGIYQRLLDFLAQA